ncbi:SpoIIE family protein phosphatase [Streptomyces sp. NPDC002055]|uniref:SpoIIE family protein phosphatase n=1 Tax=Streptomyces sp. NPDC002055 TaxID=3154534 RepID=UPI003319D5BE
MEEKAQVGPEIFEPAQVVVGMTRGPGHELVYVNAAYRRVFGDRTLRVPLRDSFPELVGTGFIALMDRVYAAKQAEQVAGVRAPAWAEGGPRDRFFTYNCSPTVLPDGTDGVLIVAMDVTQSVLETQQVRAHSEEQQRELNRYQALLETVSEGIWLANADGTRWWSAMDPELENRDPLEWLAETVHPDDQESLRRAWVSAMRSTPAVFEHGFRQRSHAGEYRHAVARAVPILDQGELVEWVGTTTDVEEEWRATRRERLLAAAAASTEAASLEAALTALARTIVPELADECGIYIVSELGGHGRGPTVASRIVGIARAGLPSLPVPRRTEHPIGELTAQTLAEGRPRLLTFPPGLPPHHVVPEEIETWLAEVQATSLVLLPIDVGGSVTALATLFTCAPTASLGPETINLLREILDHAHAPLHRAHRFQRAQRVALTLQRAMLTDPPEIPGAELAVHYQPSALAAEVGGDWYDAFPLPDHSYALTIGDVVGHDLAAASAMGQLRSMLRTLACHYPADPARALAHLDVTINGLSVTELASAIQARLTPGPGGWQVLWSNAGHPPPLLIHGDGTYDVLGEARHGADPPLGVDPSVPRRNQRTTLHPEDTLLLYTDGLVETPGEDLEDAIGKLAGIATEGRHLSAAALCGHLISHAPPTGDDIALLALRPALH